MFASRMGVGAIASDGMFGNSKNICISSGAKNSENAIDIGLHESEGLGGCTTQPSWFNSKGDHCRLLFFKKRMCVEKSCGKILIFVFECELSKDCEN